MKTSKALLLFIVAFLLMTNQQTRGCTFSASFTGTTYVCPGTSVNYLSKLTINHYYRWVVTGGTIVSGQRTDSLWVNWPTPGTWSVKFFDSTLTCKDSVTKTIYVGLSSPVLTGGSYSLQGKATSSGKKVTMTDNNGSESSAAWNNYRINLNKNFDLRFITNQNGGADGMMFIIQNSGLGSSGGGQGSDLGYYAASTGTMDQSIGIEEDIYKSTAAYDDSSASHLNLVMDKSPTPLRKQVNITSPALGAGNDHKLRITWNKDINLFEVYFDGTKEFSWPNDIVKNVFGGNPNVYFGFTGATGGVASTQTFTPDTLIYNQAIINVKNDTVCSGDSVVLTSSFGVSYICSTGAKTRSIKTLTTGTYTVTVTDSFGCITAATYALPNIVVLPKVSASFSVGIGCVGANVPITNNTTPTTGVRYLWHFGNGDSATGVSPTYAYKNTGSYTINVSATNGGCSSTASNPIAVYNHPGGILTSKSTPFQGQFNTGDIYHSDNACIGDTNTYQFSAPVGYANSDYGSKWLISSKSFATASGTICTDTIFKNPTSTKNAYFEFFPESKFADSVLILTMHVKLMPGNCDTAIIRYIQARPNAVSKFLFTNACQGYALSFHDTSTISSGDVISGWNWTFGDGATSLLQYPTHTYSKSGTYSVTLLATSNAGCGIPVTQTVTQYPKPVAGFHAAAGCQQTSSVFTDSSSISSGSIVTRAWTFGNGSGSALKSPSFTYPKSGPYSVKLVVTSSFGCKDSITKSIRVEPLPVATFTYNNACVGTSIYFSNKSTDSTTGTKYQWNFGDNGTSTSSQPSHTYAANGTYRTKLTVTSKYGCIDTFALKITPYAETVPNIAFSGACAQTRVAFGDSDKNDPGATYSWNFGDGISDVAVNDTDSHIYSKPGTFKASLTIQNGDGCTDTQSKSIVISAYPVASFLSGNICVGKPLTFNNTTTGSGLTYSWNFGDTLSGKSNTSTLVNPSHTYDTSGIFTVILSATNSAGCTDTVSRTVNSAAPPIVKKWSYKIHNDSITFTPNDITQKTYKWYFGTGDSSSVKKPGYFYKTKGKYGVKLVETNATGCSAFYADSITITGVGFEQISGPKNNLDISIYPNPFESKTVISYTLKGNSKVTLSVYDLQGKLIAELKDGYFEPGKYQDEFNAAKYNTNDGVYLLKMTVNGEVFTGRIVEMK